MIIKLLVDGGDMKPGPAVGQKLGPLGINIGKVVQDVSKATNSFKGIKVPVELIIAKDKTFSVKVLSPPTAELLKKELGIEKASGESKKTKVANASIEQIISVAKIKHPDMLANNFKSAVKSVVGSCVSSGILIESKEAKEVEKEIDDGKYNKEIQAMKTQAEAEKKQKLDEYFAEIKSKQEALVKKAEEEKAEAEAKKAEEKPAEEKKESTEEKKEEKAKPEAKEEKKEKKK